VVGIEVEYLVEEFSRATADSVWFQKSDAGPDQDI
jgi:hypothetical protein